MKTVSCSSLPGGLRALVAAAARVRATAYCPYSGFKVGAALLAEGGAMVTGSNVENAAYGSSICAERAALVRANAMGLKGLRALAVVAGAAGGGATAPCGACRQMLWEAAQVAGRDIKIILASPRGRKTIVTSVRELLPLPFAGPRRRK